MRQPSAEDLDAAHQLVSSARGERNSNYVSVDTSRGKTQDPLSPDIGRESLETVDSGGDEFRQSPDVGSTSGSEQFCR